MKFYRYIIYKLYSRLRGKENKFVASTQIGFSIAFVHAFQLGFIYFILLKIFPQINIFDKMEDIFVSLSFLVFAIPHQVFLFTNNRMENYFNEFKDEPPSVRRKGTVIVTLYLLGSIFFTFLLALLLFHFVK